MEYVMPTIQAEGEQLATITRLFKEAIQECIQCKIDFGKISKIKINRRYTAWGVCKQQPDRTFQIELSRMLFDGNGSEDGIKNTLLHEICHTVPNGHGHKAGWRAAANKLNAMFGYNIKRADDNNSKGVEAIVKPAKYTLRCTKCGHVFTRMKMSKLVQHPEYFRCGHDGHCGGKIERVS